MQNVRCNFVKKTVSLTFDLCWHVCFHIDSCSRTERKKNHLWFYFIFQTEQDRIKKSAEGSCGKIQTKMIFAPKTVQINIWRPKINMMLLMHVWKFQQLHVKNFKESEQRLNHKKQTWHFNFSVEFCLIWLSFRCQGSIIRTPDGEESEPWLVLELT